MKRTLLVAVLGAISLSACAQDPAAGAATATATTAASAIAEVQPEPGSADARAVAAIKTLNERIEVESVGPSPMPGFREAIVGGQVVYVSDDGRYLFLPGSGGALIDSRTERNLTEASLAALRVELLDTIPESARIVFAPPDPVHTVTVFTDVECGYCRKLHSEIDQYLAQGIAIEYLAFPRMGIGSEDYRKMVSVWCADDRKRALTQAKSGSSVPQRTCKTTVDMQYNVGQRVGLTGTPMILAEDGTQLGGYVPAAALREALDRIAAQNGKAAAGSTTGA